MNEAFSAALVAELTKIAVRISPEQRAAQYREERGQKEPPGPTKGQVTSEAGVARRRAELSGDPGIVGRIRNLFSGKKQMKTSEPSGSASQLLLPLTVKEKGKTRRPLLTEKASPTKAEVRRRAQERVERKPATPPEKTPEVPAPSKKRGVVTRLGEGIGEALFGKPEASPRVRAQAKKIREEGPSKISLPGFGTVEAPTGTSRRKLPSRPAPTKKPYVTKGKPFKF